MWEFGSVFCVTHLACNYCVFAFVFEHVFDEVCISLAGCTLMSNDLQGGCLCISICICISISACICICRSGYFFGRLHTDEQWLARRVGQYAFGKRSSYPVFVFPFFWWSIFGILYFILCSDENAPNAKVPKHRAQLFFALPISPGLAIALHCVLQEFFLPACEVVTVSQSQRKFRPVEKILFNIVPPP